MTQFKNHEHTDENMIKIEVNLDDTSGELLGYVIDKLFELGVNDAYYIPIYMKKNRPGTMLQILCETNQLDQIKKFLLNETTTLGFRYYKISVFRSQRTFKKVDTKWGAVTVKVGYYQGEVIQQSPEFEECKAIAEKYDLPLKNVYQEIWKHID